MMQYRRQTGFSLTEVLLAAGILSIGMVMIAMVFPVGVKLTSVATERTIASSAASEAFVKFRLYSAANTDTTNSRIALDCSKISPTACMDLPSIQRTSGLTTCFLETLEPNVPAVTNPTIDNAYERWYPSVVPVGEKKYHWSVLARRVDTNHLQVIVFVSRLLSMGGVSYYDMGHNEVPKQANNDSPFPVPVKIYVEKADAKAIMVKPYNNVYTSSGSTIKAEYLFFREGSTIVENSTGQIFRVLEMQNLNSDAGNDTLVLDKEFPLDTAYVWVVPPAVGSTRNPCIGVFQRILTF